VIFETIQQLEAKLMRSIILFSLALCASPALGQSAVQAAPHAIRVPRELTDPATVERVANVVQATTDAFLNLPVGDVQAALEGRQPSPEEKRLTVRDLGRRDDPDFDRNIHRQISEAKPMIEHGMKALSEALPAVMKGLKDASRAIDRAAANMPDPTYPKR
jgi:hypothetical protein